MASSARRIHLTRARPTTAGNAGQGGKAFGWVNGDFFSGLRGWGRSRMEDVGVFVC
jgi:hypothetical protein